MLQKILVLDDEENYAKMLHSLLEQHFFIVDSATKPESALKALEEKEYELVISDYKMPVMDGADFLQKSRQITPSLPVILVSGLMNTPELVKVANMGVTLVLEKPIDIDNFISHVKRFVQPLSEEDFHRLKSEQAGSDTSLQDAAAKDFVRSYPAQSRWLSDESPAMQHFLQELWDAIQEQAHVFMKSPPGCEFELLMRELSRWQELPADPLTFIDVASSVTTAVADKIKALGESSDASPIVGVYGYAAAPLPQQDQWVDLMREAPESIVFVHVIDESLFDQDPLPINPELYELIEQSSSQWPALYERMTDLAVYTKRLLASHAGAMGRPERGQLAEDALGVILHYRWPGNYRELGDVLRRTVALAEAGPVTAAELQEILTRSGARHAGKVSLPKLKDFLTHEQVNLIELTLRNNGGDLTALLDCMDIDPALTANAKSTAELGLLFPELLTAKA